LGSAAPADLFLIYYSGHGKLDRKGRLCLATADTSQGALLATSIPPRNLRDLVEESDCDQVVLLLDCCYSGAVDGLRGDVSSELVDKIIRMVPSACQRFCGFWPRTKGTKR
jgi:uncharacterized caspase-like protein